MRPIILALLLLLPTVAAAQVYPTGPIRIVVPFPPAGGTDILARALAQKLNEAWSVPVIVENRGGANGTIGSAYVAKSTPDGHTALFIPSGFAVNPSIYPKLPFDTAKDFAPVSVLAEGPLVLSLHPSFPPRTVKELVAFLKARPGEINYGSSGNGSPPHLATELFNLPDIKDRLTSQGAILVGNAPDEFAVFLRSEMATTAKIVKASGMTATN